MRFWRRPNVYLFAVGLVFVVASFFAGAFAAPALLQAAALCYRWLMSLAGQDWAIIFALLALGFVAVRTALRRSHPN